DGAELVVRVGDPSLRIGDRHDRMFIQRRVDVGDLLPGALELFDFSHGEASRFSPSDLLARAFGFPRLRARARCRCRDARVETEARFRPALRGAGLVTPALDVEMKGVVANVVA